MKDLVFILEEPSAKEMLEGVLPRLLKDCAVTWRYLVFEGKNDLEKQLPIKLRNWRRPNSYFLIMRDKDSSNCLELKSKLLGIVADCGKTNVSLVRIACHELESFYIGDLDAVEKGLELNNIASKQGKSKFRTPDNIANPAQELIKLTGQCDQKVRGSREIGKHLKLDGSNLSTSFNCLIGGIMKLSGC